MKQSRLVQYFVAFGVSLSSMTSSVVLFWSVPILHKFLSNEIGGIHMTNTEVSWIITVISPGMVIGGLVASVVSDKLGRRFTLLASAVPFIIGTVFVLCARSIWMLYIARVLWGCGSGMSATVSPLYISEIADKEIRGRLTAGTRVMFNFGATLVLVVGSFISYQILSSMVIASALCYLVVCWWLPESPYFLLKEGKVVAARKALLKLSGLKDDKDVNEKLSLMRSDVKREMARSGSIKELFTGKQYRKAIIICVGLKSAQVMTGSIPIQQYLGPIILDSNCGFEVSTVMIVFGILRFLVVFLASAIIDKVGRRPLLISSFAGASLTLFAIGLYFYLKDVIDMSSYRNFVFIGLIVFKTIANLGFDILIFVVPAEIFPMNVKAKAMTALGVYSSLIAFVVMRGFQIVQDLLGLQGVFWGYAASAVIGAVFTYFVIPETRGRSLREIQMDLQGDLYGEDVAKLHQVVTADAAEVENEVDENTELTSMRITEKEILK